MDFDIEAFGGSHEGPTHDHPQPSQEELMREFASLKRAGPLAACDVMSQFHKEGTDIWLQGAPTLGIDLGTPEGWAATYGYVMGLMSSLLAIGPQYSAQLDANIMTYHRLTHITKSAVQWCREHDVQFPILEAHERKLWEDNYGDVK